MQLLTKLLLNPASTVYLRGLERDLGVSSNTVRLELNKLSDMQLIQEQGDDEKTKTKHIFVVVARGQSVSSFSKCNQKRKENKEV